MTRGHGGEKSIESRFISLTVMSQDLSQKSSFVQATQRKEEESGGCTHWTKFLPIPIPPSAAQSSKKCGIRRAPLLLPSPCGLLQTLWPRSPLRAMGHCLERHGSQSKESRRTTPVKSQVPRRQALPLLNLSPRGVTKGLATPQAEEQDDDPERPLATEI